MQPLRDQMRKIRLEIALMSAELEERVQGRRGGKVPPFTFDHGYASNSSEHQLRHLVQRSLPSAASPDEHGGFREAVEFAIELHQEALVVEGMSPVMWACVKMADTRNGYRFLDFASRIVQISPQVQVKILEILLRNAQALTELAHIEAIVQWIAQILAHSHKYLASLPPRNPTFRQMVNELSWRRSFWQTKGPIGHRVCELLREVQRLV